MNSQPSIPNIRKKDWLADEIITYLETKKPTCEYKAGDIVPHDVVVDVSQTLSPAVPRGESRYQWFNQYQLEQTVRKVANWHGFTGKSSGTDILCTCSK